MIGRFILEIQDELNAISSSLRREIALISDEIEYKDGIIARLQDELDMLSEQTFQFLENLVSNQVTEASSTLPQESRRDDDSNLLTASQRTEKHGMPITKAIWNDVLSLGKLSSNIRRATSEKENKMQILFDHILTALRDAYLESLCNAESQSSPAESQQATSLDVTKCDNRLLRGGNCLKKDKQDEAYQQTMILKTRLEKLEDERFSNKLQASLAKIGILQLSKEVKEFSKEFDSFVLLTEP
eukprot:764146-Hanusia_phi.AAC.1